MADDGRIEELNKCVKDMSVDQIIRLAYKEFDGHIVFATSLSEEDQVITDVISKTVSDVEIFTLDTGRLFKETYELLDKTQKKYSLNFKTYYPDTEAVENMVRNYGINLFYDSVSNRKLCCGIRKVQPLKRALKNANAWICGLRRGQSVTRNQLQVFEWDQANEKVKVNPLADWTSEDVSVYVVKNKLDVNALHQKGYVSIGCSCCTRAISEGEDVRAGRWWWEAPEHKECGLHGKKIN